MIVAEGERKRELLLIAAGRLEVSVVASAASGSASGSVGALSFTSPAPLSKTVGSSRCNYVSKQQNR